jgi:hypothetical protein
MHLVAWSSTTGIMSHIARQLWYVKPALDRTSALGGDAGRQCDVE